MSLSTLQRSRSRHVGRAYFETLEDRRLLSFTPATSFPIGADPQAVVTADFNNDGKLDLATSNYDIPLNGVFRFAVWPVGDKQLFAAAAHEDRGVPILLMLGTADGDVA